MKSWKPTTSDLDWTRRMIGLLKVGGVWGCPAGFSAWIKARPTSVTFDGPINDGDVFEIEIEKLGRARWHIKSDGPRKEPEFRPGVTKVPNVGEGFTRV